MVNMPYFRRQSRRLPATTARMKSSSIPCPAIWMGRSIQSLPNRWKRLAMRKPFVMWRKLRTRIQTAMRMELGAGKYTANENGTNSSPAGLGYVQKASKLMGMDGEESPG